jgi:hypothetical protein
MNVVECQNLCIFIEKVKSADFEIAYFSAELAFHSGGGRRLSNLSLIVLQWEITILSRTVTDPGYVKHCTEMRTTKRLGHSLLNVFENKSCF